jgi:hypothetical protein
MRPPAVDVCAWYRVFRHIGLDPIKAAETVADRYAREVADAIDRSDETPVLVNPIGVEMRRYRIARRWERQAAALTERRFARHMDGLTADWASTR